MKAFISYSQRDKRLREDFEKHLSNLGRAKVLQSWHDRKITAGSEWKGRIDHHLNSADIIFPLISADFMASDYCWDVELTRAVERHNKGEARVIPVLLRPVDWQDAPFAKFQVLPRNAKPVTTWRNRDAAFLDVITGIRIVINEITRKDKYLVSEHNIEKDYVVVELRNSNATPVEALWQTSRRTIEEIRYRFPLVKSIDACMEGVVLALMVPRRYSNQVQSALNNSMGSLITAEVIETELSDYININYKFISLILSREAMDEIRDSNVRYHKAPMKDTSR